MWTVGNGFDGSNIYNETRESAHFCAVSGVVSFRLAEGTETDSPAFAGFGGNEQDVFISCIMTEDTQSDIPSCNDNNRPTIMDSTRCPAIDISLVTMEIIKESDATATEIILSAEPTEKQQLLCERTKHLCGKLSISLLILSAISAAFLITMETALPSEGHWSHLESHHCDEYCENSDQCDHTMEQRSTIQQPVNAYTNLAYMWCGIVPLVFLRIDISTIMYFCASALLAASSFMYHASLTRFWMFMDGANMYTFVGTLISHGIHVVFGIPWKFIAPILVAFFIAMPLLQPKIFLDSTQVMAIQLGIVVILASIVVLAHIFKIVHHGLIKRSTEATSWIQTYSLIVTQVLKIGGVALVPAIVAGIAVIIWYQDREKQWCDPASILQLHGLWHVLTAFASLWNWLFFDCYRLKNIITSCGCDGTKVGTEGSITKPFKKAEDDIGCDIEESSGGSCNTSDTIDLADSTSFSE